MGITSSYNIYESLQLKQTMCINLSDRQTKKETETTTYSSL